MGIKIIESFCPQNFATEIDALLLPAAEQYPVKKNLEFRTNRICFYFGRVKIRIKERSLYARVAARQLKCKTVAAVFGNTIHLWNVSREDFLQRTPWVVHEVEHVRQFQRYGFLRFSALYLLEYTRNGYYNNRFEVEARVAEMGEGDLVGIEFI